MIQHHLLQHETLSQYNNVIFNAIAEKQPLSDVHVLTLKGEFVKKIEKQAISHVTARNQAITTKNIYAEMSRIFDLNVIQVREKVKHSSEGMFVVVNASVIDDQAVFRIFQLVKQALDQLDGKYGTVHFGEPTAFEKHEISWLNLH